MVTKDEFEQLISEFESFRDLTLEELIKLKNDIEKVKDSMDDLVKDLSNGNGVNKKRLG